MFTKPLDFYVKWLATIVALLHVILTAHDVAPYYKFTGLLGASLWIMLSFLWKEPSLILLNIIMALIYIHGILL
jgi:hypothetical protein